MFKSQWKQLSMAADMEWTIEPNECQRSVNDLWFCKYYNYTVHWLMLCITNELAAIIGKRDNNTVTTPFRDWVSTEHLQSINEVSMMFSFPSWVIYIPIDCSYPFIRYWQSLKGKSTMTCSLRHTDNEYQQSVNNVYLRILANLYSDWVQISRYQILASFTGNNNSEILPASFSKSALSQHQQC